MSGGTLSYQKMEEENHENLSDREEKERQLFAKKKSRSKSLPNNSLIDPRRQTQLKLKLQHLQQQQQQQLLVQQQQVEEAQQPRRKSSPLTLPILQVRTFW
jgi:hypothetical protein